MEGVFIVMYFINIYHKHMPIQEIQDTYFYIEFPLWQFFKPISVFREKAHLHYPKAVYKYTSIQSCNAVNQIYLVQ
jgi:hypothetical protein